MYDQKRMCKKSFNKYKYFIKLAIISNLHNITVFFLIENHIILKNKCTRYVSSRYLLKYLIVLFVFMFSEFNCCIDRR